MKYYYNGEWFSQYIENAVAVSMGDFDRLICGQNRGLVITSNSEGYPILSNPYSGEEYVGDWSDFDISAEAEYIEIMRVRGIKVQIEEQKSYLDSTDWVNGKGISYIGENGLDMNRLYEILFELYPEEMTLRARARASINELELKLQ